MWLSNIKVENEHLSNLTLTDLSVALICNLAPVAYLVERWASNPEVAGLVRQGHSPEKD